MSSDEILKILITFDDFFKLANLGADIGRNILFGIARFFLWIVQNLENIMTEMLTFLGFFNDSSLKGEGGLLQTLISFKSFGVGIAILTIGLVLIFGKSSQTRDIPMNVLMLLLMSLMLPTIMSDGMKLVKATQGEFSATQGDIGFSTIKNNVTDVFVLADGGWKTTKPENKNYLTDVTGFDVNERILDPDEVENGEVLKYKLRNKQNEEGKEAVELDEGNGGVLGWLIKSMFAPKYYRWKVDWIPLIVTLGVLAFSLVISMVRVGRLGIELAFNELWANIVVFFSFRETKRAKMVLMEIVGGFVMVISIFTMYYVFIYYNSFVFATNTSVWAQLFAVVGGAWFIYDGPAIIQKTLGIDAGLSTAGSFVMGMGAKKAVDQIGSGVKTTVGAATSGTVATAGFVAGLASGNAERKNDEDANLNKFDTDNESEKNTEDTNNAPQDESNDTQTNDPSKDVSEETNEAVNDEDIGISKSEGDSDQETSENTNSLDNQEKNGEDINDSAVDENGTNDVKETEDFESKNTDTETNDQNMSDYDEQENVNDDTPKNTSTANEGQLNNMKMADNEDENSKYTGESSNMEHSDSDSESESPSNSSSEPLENPFKKKVSQMVNTNKYQKNMKNPIGNQVDRYKRNKEFGQEVNEWLAQRKEQKSQQLPKEKRPKNKKG